MHGATQQHDVAMDAREESIIYVHAAIEHDKDGIQEQSKDDIVLDATQDDVSLVHDDITWWSEDGHKTTPPVMSESQATCLSLSPSVSVS